MDGLRFKGTEMSFAIGGEKIGFVDLLTSGVLPLVLLLTPALL